MVRSTVVHMKKRIKVKDIADYCMVSSITVRRWIKRGELTAIRLPSGHYRVNIVDFRKFVEKWNEPVNEDIFKSKSKKKGGQ